MPRRLLVVTALLTLAACQRAPKPHEPPARPAAPAEGSARPTSPGPDAAAARLVEPERIRFAPRVTVTGTLKARQASPLAMSVPGILTSVAVKRGQEVRAGAVLASLDDGVAAASRRQAEAAVAAARAQLAITEDALARVTRLRSEDGASEAQAFQARAQRDGASAQVAVAEAQLEQARVHLAHHHLTAPFSGVVTRVPDGLGVTVAPGVPLVTLVSTRELVLETSLTQAEAAELVAGTKATVSVPASGARTSDASVAVVVPAVDAATNRVPVEIAVSNREGRFLPNAFARAELARGAERDAWRVPSGALTQREGGYGVWIAGADAKARVLPVRVLAEEGESTVVAPESGAWPGGAKVVEAPPSGLAEGTPVAEVRG